MINIEDLTVKYFLEGSSLTAVNGASLQLKDNEILGLVGPSGCGKSTLGAAMIDLVSPPGMITSGRILINGRDILRMNREDKEKVRGKEISMIFQDPFTTLNPVLTIGDQISETLVIREKFGRKDALERAAALLQQVGIDDPGSRLKQYPHQLSGGMRQRVMIAIALSCGAKHLIADEPTTSLDVITQTQIMDLLSSLRASYGLSVLFISHNRKLVGRYCDRSVEMKEGRMANNA